MTKSAHQSTWAVAAMIILIAMAYANTFSVPFIFDDTINILENASIRQLWPPWHSFLIPADTGLASRPVVNLSLAVNYAISDFKVWSYHVVNLVIHLLATFTLFGIVRRTIQAVGKSYHGPDNSLLISLACALLWGLHPLQTQSVTYIIQRCESLMSLFFLLTFYSALRGWQSGGPTRWHLLAVMFFLLAVGSKEVAVVAPFLLPAYEWTFRGQHPSQAIKQSPLLYGGLALGLFMALLMTFAGNTLASRTEQVPIALLNYWITQCQVILHYLRIAVWPSGLTIDYGWPVATFSTAWPAATAVLILAGLSSWAFWKREPAGFLGIGFFLILAPSSLIPLPDLAFEHRMYLPLAAVVIIVVFAVVHSYTWIMNKLRPWSAPESDSISKVAIIAVSCISLILGVLTFNRNQDYRSEMAIWSDTIKKRPDNFRGYHGLGLALSRAGKLDEGLANLRRALKLNSRNAYVYNDTGFILYLLNRPSESIPYFQKAIQIKPRNPKGHNNLGAALAQTNRLEEAIVHFSIALRMKPDYAGARNNLANAASAQKRRFTESR